MEFASCGRNYQMACARISSTHSYQKLATHLKEGMKRGELKQMDPTLRDSHA